MAQAKSGSSKRTSFDEAAENERLRRANSRLSRRVAELEAAVPAEQADATVQRSVGQLAVLTAREREVLNCFIECKSDKLVAVTLGLSSQTVHNHMAAILNKLNLSARVDLIAAFAVDAATT
jgi:DNA-binding NarL/FixJ family response regulator